MAKQTVCLNSVDRCYISIQCQRMTLSFFLKLTLCYNTSDFLSTCCYVFKHTKIFYGMHKPPHDKTNKMSVRPAKTQISLGIRPVWSESSLCAQWIAKGPMFLHADSTDSDQTGRMPRLIWVFAGRTLILLVLSWCGSCTRPTYVLTSSAIQKKKKKKKKR